MTTPPCHTRPSRPPAPHAMRAGGGARGLRLAVAGWWLAGMVAGAQAQALAPAAAAAELQAALQATGDRARGEAAFVECVACHRKDAAGRATARVPRLAGQHARVIIKQFVDIRSGQRINEMMKPIIEDMALTPQTLADIATFLQALPAPATPASTGPGEALARGKTLFERDCVGCHGTQGEGNAAEFRPRVATQHYGYLVHELERIRSGARGNSDPAMRALLQPYTPQDLQAVADHLSRLPPPRP